MISLHSYEYVEDAWQHGVAAWCRAASSHVLSGGRAWLVTVNDGQANWIRRRLLREGVTLAGVQFLDAASLRHDLCLRCGVPPDLLGNTLLGFTLRLRALAHARRYPAAAAVARQPADCLAALGDLAAAGWLEDGAGAPRDILPVVLDSWLTQIRADGHWRPDIDARLWAAAKSGSSDQPPLAVCVLGWDASFWPQFPLIAAAASAARDAVIYAPLPRGASENIQIAWLTALEDSLGETFQACPSVDFPSFYQGLISRLERADLTEPGTPAAEPELLVGLDADDAAVLTRAFICRWLAASDAARTPSEAGGDRLVIVSPRRNVSALTLLRQLTAAGIAVEDQMGEVPEASLDVQIQRAILAYHQEDAHLEDFLTLIELLNEEAPGTPCGEAGSLRNLFPLDPLEVRRALHATFGDLQHHNVRVLSEGLAHARSDLAGPLRRLVEHLGEWPAELAWPDALDRWQRCLAGLGLDTAGLEPLWSKLVNLAVPDLVPAAAFYDLMAEVLGRAPARRSPEAGNRYARVVMTTLTGAVGQTWGAAVFLDSNEGVWPLYPGENSFLDDAQRVRLNQAREDDGRGSGARWRGYLLTATDQAQLEHFRFIEVFGNCSGPVAFAGLARDPADPASELYANEWALRCLLEAGSAATTGEKLLDRWRGAIRRAPRAGPALSKVDRDHLGAVFRARRDPTQPFDEYGFNFEALGAADELPWGDPWPARDLESAWSHPATFAIRQVFGVTPAPQGGREFLRGESWLVGRLVHQWVRTALGGAREPRRLSAHDWEHARTHGLPAAQQATELLLRVALAKQGALPAGGAALPFWWRSTVQKARWTASRCLESLARVAGGSGSAEVWLTLGRRFRANIATVDGSLRVQGHCDISLADRPEPAGASCQLIDVKSGAGQQAPVRIEKGRGLDLAALVFLALQEGARPEDTQIGIVHPDLVQAAVLTARSKEIAAPALAHLARQQRSLNFGQRGASPAADGTPRDRETLPLATVTIDPGVLSAKAALSPVG